MTNKEAIRILKEQHKSPALFISLEEWRDYNDALDLAINALAAQEANGWVSCSDGMPEEDKDVLISYRYKDEDSGDTYIDITDYGWAYFGGRRCSFKEWRSPFPYFHSNCEVVAWMPLPDSYRG